MAGVKRFHRGEDVAEGLGESLAWLKRYLARNHLAYTKGSNGRPRFDDEQLAAFYAHLKVTGSGPTATPLPVAGEPVLTVRGTLPRIPSAKGPRKSDRRQQESAAS